MGKRAATRFLRGFEQSCHSCLGVGAPWPVSQMVAPTDARSMPGSQKIRPMTIIGMSAGCLRGSILSESWSEPTTTPDRRATNFRLSGPSFMAQPLRHNSMTRPPQQLNSLSHRSDSFPAAANQRIAMGRMAKPATAPLILFVAVT